MIPDLKVTPPRWTRSDDVTLLFSVLGNGEKTHALLVGGCVRNLLLNRDVVDIDVATIYPPEEVMRLLNEANIKTVPTGLKYGTVTAVIDGKPFEITTLRHDIKTDGRHAEVQFTDDWAEDAKRRDFTINALFADLNGHIYDPLGQGLSDIQQPVVRFVGDPANRIQEDYLRILRFFRFHAQYGQGDMDAQALQACKTFAAHLTDLSKERITQEFLKILSVDNPVDVLRVMKEHDVLSALLCNLDMLERFCTYQKQFAVFDRIASLSLLVENIEDYLSLSNQHKTRLRHYRINETTFESVKDIKKSIYFHDNHQAVQLYLLFCARYGKSPQADFVDVAQNWHAPEFPMSGDDLIKEGYDPGKDLGLKLQELELEWLETVV